MKTPDEIREFDERQAEIRHEWWQDHQGHDQPDRECPFCFEDYVNDIVDPVPAVVGDDKED